MTIYTTGSLATDRPIPDDVQNQIFEILRGVPCETDAGKTMLHILDALGDYGDELNAIADLLEQSGIGIIPDLTGFCYYGDYEGCYVFENNAFIEYSGEDYVIRTASTKSLIAELERRGFKVK